jgi:hypothetical protein
MVLAANVAMMILAIVLGKRSNRITWKHFLALGFLTIVQIIVVVYYLFHMEKPPLF